MTSTFSTSGIQYDRYAEIVQAQNDSITDSLGESIQLDQDGAIGHILEINALANATANEIGQDVYDSGFVESSSGTTLAGNVGHVGVERSPASYSTIEQIRLKAEKACVAPSGTTYKTQTNVTFATDDELVFTAAGYGTVSGTCTVEGAIDIEKGELDTIAQSINGITKVTNLTEAIPGTSRQTDAQVKTTHTLATATSGEDDSSAIYEALYEIPVTAAKVIDNDTGYYDGITPPNTIQVVVIGGTDEDVATAIWNNKTTGVPTFGSSSDEVYDSTYGQSRTINFTRGDYNSNQIVINITKLVNYPADGDTTIKEALATIYDNYDLGSTAIYDQCKGAAYSVAGVVVNSFTLADETHSAGVIDLENADDSYPTLDVTRDDAGDLAAINVTIDVS